MFRQIWVTKEHQDFQRIIWRFDQNEPIKHYRLCTVTYGTASAPFLSVRVLEQIAQDYKNLYPSACQILLDDFYVDDVLTGAATESDLVVIRDQLVELLSLAGLHLSKWVSNSRYIAVDQQDKEFPILEDGTDFSKVLGIKWLPAQDIICYKIYLEDSDTVSKRKLISEVSRIYDPLGLVSPVIVKFKILFQCLWLLNLGWDEPLPSELAVQWHSYRQDLKHLNELKIERFVANTSDKIELHGFCDASIKAFSAVVYCKVTDENNVIKVSLVAAKTRVAPLKQVSLPRLELCGALLLARLMSSVSTSLRNEDKQLFAWCDSTVVLAWLSKQPISLKTFVANRVSEILDTIPRNAWRHVKSQENPADCASRGIMSKELISHQLWWSGPSWLRNKIDFTANIQSEIFDIKNIPEAHNELRPLHVTLLNQQQEDHILDLLAQRTSTWKRLLRATAYIKRFISHATKRKSYSNLNLTFDELQEAKISLLRQAQQSVFMHEIKCLQKKQQLPMRSKILSLTPFLDQDSLLRVGGRITNSMFDEATCHPIILPKHRITYLLLIDEHIKNFHPGVSALFVIVRQTYWILGARNQIKKLTHECLKCFRQMKHTSQQVMADLPKVRVRQAFPFENSGCDYAGPFLVKTHKGRGAKVTKAYICVFVCMVTSAVHLELATDLTTECFIAAFRRFVARRGICSNVYSDNGRNFVGASKCLNEMYKLIQSEEHNQQVSTILAHDNIKWHFIPPYSPHWGGMWESAVRSVKLHLKRVVCDTILTHEQFFTLLTQIEAVVNSRPLGYAPDTEFNYLSPSHFLIGRPYTSAPDPDLANIKTSRLSYWQHIQAMFQGFWKRWSNEYITSLQQRRKWKQEKPDLEVGHVVLLKNEKTSPATWVIGKVTELIKNADGHCRAAKVLTSSGETIRTITKLAKLPTF